ncbi:MAG: hypothetical protein HY815_19955 [Candidatus Riflebacteria bacterium]|nr:hypothetical protein [Candidatus Riflebacteria bacterium]
MRIVSFSVTLALVLLSIPVVAHAGFDQISPPEGYQGIEFKHLVMNGAGQFVAVSGSQVFVGNAKEGTISKVLANDRLGFVVQDGATQMVDNKTLRLDLDVLGTRVAINEAGDYIVASHTTLFIGKAAGGEPRKVFEDSKSMFLQVAINNAGHYAAISRRCLVVGAVADATAVRLVEDAPATFIGYTIDGINGNWGVEVGETHLAVNQNGQFVATTGRAVYGGSIPTRTVQKMFEDSKTNFRQVQLAPTGEFVVVSVKNVFRGKLGQ